jgi:lipopolysaccharide transport system ATP-binding protein
MPPVIRVENLGKKYTLRHQGEAGVRYRRFSEELLDALKRPLRSLLRAPHSLTPSTSHLTPGSREEFWALRNVSFEVQQGEVLGIIGRNGAGKSTLLKILSRITEPTEGRVTLNGRVASLLEVGTGFHPELTGRENVFLNGAVLGMSRAEIRRKFDEIVAFAEVEKFLDTPVKRYSSGMYVRLAFAVAAHLEPEILIVDEVLAVGDQAFQRKCFSKMHSAMQEGRTILFVSHNIPAVTDLCATAILLERGHIRAAGAAVEIAGTYLTSLNVCSELALRDRTDRTGQGKVRLHAVEVRTTGMADSGAAACGQPACFAFRLSTMIPHLVCRFTIYDEAGHPILHMATEARDKVDQAAADDDVLLCEVDELLLAPGQYRINVALSADGDVQDHVEGAAGFTVQPGVLRGRPIGDSAFARAVMPYAWRAVSSAELAGTGTGVRN